MVQHSIAVVYICWIPFGSECFQDFLDSYKHQPAGVPHDLIVIFKGADDISSYLRMVETSGIAFQQLHYTGSGLDIATYQWCANQISHKNIFFLNSRSRILIDSWLAKFQSASQQYPKLVLGATGSWQSYASSVFTNDTLSWEKQKSVKANFNKYKRLLKAATLWWYYFPWFPNAHLRTNGFLINRLLFLSLHVEPISVKINAYRFESGRHGFSAQIKKLGYNIGLVGKTGKVYLENEWPQSNIFWSAEQENLIIGDNQTSFYDEANEIDKAHLSNLAWGKVL